MKKLFIAIYVIVITTVIFAEQYTITDINGNIFTFEQPKQERFIGLGVSKSFGLRPLNLDFDYRALCFSFRSRKLVDPEHTKFTLGSDFDVGYYRSSLNFGYSFNFGGAVVRNDRFTLIVSGGIRTTLGSESSLGGEADVFAAFNFTKRFGLFFNAKGIINIYTLTIGNDFSDFGFAMGTIGVRPSMGIAWRL